LELPPAPDAEEAEKKAVNAPAQTTKIRKGHLTTKWTAALFLPLIVFARLPGLISSTARDLLAAVCWISHPGI
jgi:hypothetical protein